MPWKSCGSSWPLSPRLERLAGFLPAVPCAGFEFSLTDERGVDLQQRIRSDVEVRRLKALLRRLRTQGRVLDGSPWAHLEHFCGSNLLGDAVEELWLELDDGAYDALPPLSVFVRLSEASTASAAAATIDAVLDAFRLHIDASRRRLLATCLAALRGEARISHLGLMLARPSAPLRLIVDRVDHDDMLPLLERAGWHGTPQPLQARLDDLFTHVDRIRLALTVGDRLEPSIGLECFLGDPNRYDPRWRSTLDWLLSQHLCTVEQRARVLAWPRRLLPATATEPWPVQMVVDSLARDAAIIDWLDCRVSHVKVTHDEQRPASAKAYVGVLQVLDDARLAAPKLTPQATLRARAPLGLQAARDAAVRHLVAARNQAGWWQDYEGFREGISDEWVTAYVAHALVECGVDAARASTLRAWQLLSRRARAGWGWNYLQPADADSTLWALRLAARLGESGSPSARTGLAFLRRHVGPTGVSTYLEDHHREWSGGATINPGWYEPHMCVTAAAAGVPALGDAPLAALRAGQRADGSWQGYWWKSPVYTTVLAAEALHASTHAEDQARFDAAVTWVARRMDACDLPFEQALMLRLFTLRPMEHRTAIAALQHALLRAQESDGSWRGSAELAIPNAAGREVAACDARHSITTATVVNSLCRITP